MNTDAINDIRKAADAATKGPYDTGKHGALGDVSVASNGDSILFVQAIQGDTYDHQQRKANTDYFALLDPATVLELCRLAEIGERSERGEAELDAIRAPKDFLK